ncbi:MAG: lamin tail domain-containing protein [Phycisphaerales bacterium]|nr:MAG: lamin tail domain-containing protein [Phycisphaerales bacterium]
MNPKGLLIAALLSTLCLACDLAHAGAAWTTYNDCIRDPGDTVPANTTNWTIYAGYTDHSTGKLKDFATGDEAAMPTVTFTMNSAAPVATRTDYGDNPAPGTVAHEVFAGKVDFGGTIIQHHGSNENWWVEIKFTGLDPAKTYTFVGTAIRISPADTDRISLITISDADSYANNSSSPAGHADWVGADTTKFLAVNNAALGLIVRWDDIVPGADGDFTIRAEADKSEGSHGRRAYPLHGFMLQQAGESNRPPQVDAGEYEARTWPNRTIELSPTVEDDDPSGYGMLNYKWSQLGGPGTVTFSPADNIKDPAATFSGPGVYELLLQAWDEVPQEGNDVTVVTIAVSNCPVGDLDDDCMVGFRDVQIFADQWLGDGCSGGSCADLDGRDGANLADYSWLAANWLSRRGRGGLQVIIEPQVVRDAGAQWSLDGRSWFESGYTLIRLSAGAYTIKFTPVESWAEPVGLQSEVYHGQTTQTTATYVRPTGSLRVTIQPQEAVPAGAQWRVDGGAWRDSGYTQTGLSVGPHVVEFSSIKDRATPGDQQVQIEMNQVTSLIGTYLELSGATVVISEFMAINSYIPATNPLNIYTQVYGHDVHPDWIELHNMDPAGAVNLQGWYLTDDPEDPAKWRFGAGVTIAPNGYYVLFASSKTRAENPGNYPFVDEDGSLHTNFELSGNGEYLALVKPDGVTVAHEYAPEYPRQRGLISYGISSSGEMSYLLSPTPGRRARDTWSGAANSAGYMGVVGDTKFSHTRGFYDEPFHVAITCETEGATIYYSVDGGEPATVYTSPVPITTTTCLRAQAVRAGWLPSNIDTQTYIFCTHVIVQSQQPALDAGYPASWSGYPADYEMDPDICSSRAYSGEMQDALLSIPTLSIVTDKDNLFHGSTGIYTHPTQRGLSWERAASAEFFDPCGTAEIQVNCGLRVQGGASRQPNKCPKHSLSLRFRGGYGPSQLQFALFEGCPLERFDTLQIRGMFNNSWIHWNSEQRSRGELIRDQWIRDCLIDMGDVSAGYGTYAHVYLNGMYWGVYNVHERQEASHHAAYFGGDSDRLDALNSGSATDGTASSWNSMQSFVASAVSGGISLSEFEQIQRKLDIVNLIDYMIANHYGANSDWDGHNWRAAGGGFYDMPWRIYSWDAERVLEGVTSNRTGTNNSGKPSRLFHNLRNSAEFRLMFADRLHKHFFNNGAMTPTGTSGRWMARAVELDLAVIAESARWGDYRRDVHSYSNGPYQLYTKNDHWLPEQSRLIKSYFPSRSQYVLNQYKTMDLYPNVAAPSFNPHGGWDLDGFALAINKVNGSGTIWYTLDGSDPRLPGGAVNVTSARTYSGVINLTRSSHVKARVLAGGTWSALNEATFAVGPVAENLRITEIMYHPQDTNDPQDPNTEYIELQNIGVRTLNLNLVRFTNGIDFTFPDVELAPGEFVLVVKDRTAFEAEYGSGINIAGRYSGGLDNAGERIRLEDARGQIILDFRYRDGWYDITDRIGFSLTVIDAVNTDPADWGLKSTWRPSASVGGSPGFDDSGVILEPGSVKINEVLAHSHGGASDWIELHNTTGEPVNVGGWFLSDSETNFRKYEISPDTWIEKGGYVVFYEESNFGDLNDPGCHVPFALSENGETLYLHSGENGELTGYSEEEKFDASETAVAFGRYLKSTGTYNFVAMSENTPGSANAYPKVGPIVINEIMYNPSGNKDAEYVELYNISGSVVALQEWDKEQGTFVPWRFTDSGGTSFDLPPDTTMSPGERLLLVRDAAVLAAEYPAVPASVQIFVWGAGRLDNGGERVELSKPGDEADGTRHYIRVDRVNYSDGSHDDEFPYLPDGDPWPVQADGQGSALARKIGQNYGNDVVNWKAAAPSPGLANP